jgi:restriction system protein
MFSTEFTYQRRRNPRRTLYACLAVAAFAALSAGLAYALPVLEVNDRWLQRAPWRHVALWAGSTLSLLAALAAVIVHFWRTAMRGHDDLQSIRWLSPREFVRMVEEGFRTQGYVVQSSERFFSRAGIDLILRKADNHILVLCRRDPEPARQLAAVQELHAATATLQGGSGLLITCEWVASEVKAYAAEQGIAVIEGPALLKLVQRARGLQPTPVRRREPHFAIPLTDLPACSECGGPMVPGSDHDHDPEMRAWYCSRGPACHTPRLA